MKGGRQVWILAVVLVVALGLTAFVGYKLIKRQRALANRAWEAHTAIALTRAPDPEEFALILERENARLDRYEVLRPVIDDLGLIEFWQVEGPEAAFARLQQATSFRAAEDPSVLLFVARDKDKAMAERLRQAVLESYRSMARRESLIPSFGR